MHPANDDDEIGGSRSGAHGCSVKRSRQKRGRDCASFAGPRARCEVRDARDKKNISPPTVWPQHFNSQWQNVVYDFFTIEIMSCCVKKN